MYITSPQGKWSRWNSWRKLENDVYNNCGNDATDFLQYAHVYLANYAAPCRCDLFEIFQIEICSN